MTQFHAMLWACIVHAIFIASARADSFDDFTNNLFTDLAPILALFGERVTMQFLSQALGWADCLALAMGPLGIITILVSATRVGGPKWLKAIIGRAKENTAAAEIELMSSTSPEVCELYNGDSIVRCQGTAPVWEFICICPPGFDHENSNHTLPLEYMTLENAVKKKLLKEHKTGDQSSLFFPNFMRRPFQSNDRPNDSDTTEGTNETTASKTGVFQWICKFLPSIVRRSGGLDEERGQHQTAGNEAERKSVHTNLTIIRDTGPNAPNISLNLQNSHERAGIRLTALLGTFLQGGVLVFFGVMSYYPKVQPDFQKDDQPAARYASPLAISGTLLLVLGVFVCALVVENSTEETLYTANNGSKLMMCWLQQGQTVSDQVFDSYAISQSLQCSIITKSARGKDLKNKNRAERNSTLEVTTITGVVIGLVGFIIQFIGLRAMNSAASLAQLGAVGIMTICRALVRPGFARSFEKAQLLPGFELNWLSWKLVTTRSATATPPTGNAKETSGNHATTDRPSPREEEEWRKNILGSWAIVTGGTTKYKALTGKKEIKNPAHELMVARREVCKLANFQGGTSEIAIQLAISIEDALKLLFPAGVKVDQYSSVLPEVSWLIDVDYSESSSTSIKKQEVSIDLSYDDGVWKVLADSLDAALSLWTHTIRAQDKRQQHLERKESTVLAEEGDRWLRRTVPRPSLRLLGPQEPISKEQLLQDLELWVPQCLETLLQVRELEADKSKSSTKEYDKSRVFGHTQVSYTIRDDVRTRNFEIYSPVEKVSTTQGSEIRNSASSPIEKKVETSLGIETYDSLEYLCAKDLFFSFMCSAAKTDGASINGQPELRKLTTSNKDGSKSQFLWNKDLSDLAESCHKRSFGTYQEALISIISPLSMAQVLPFPHAWFEAVCAKISEAGKQDNEYTIHEIYGDLWDRTKHYQAEKTGIRECALVFLLEAQYDTEKRPSPVDCWNDLPEELSYWISESKLESTFYQKLQTLSEWAHRPLNCLFPDITSSEGSHSHNSEREYRSDSVSEVKDWAALESFPDYFQLTRSHVYALRATKGGLEYNEDESHIRDICGRIPLHYFAANNNDEYEIANYVQEGRELANIQDHHGYTPLHHACGFGSEHSVSELLQHGAKLNFQGLDGMYPLHLAAYEGNEPVIDKILEWTTQPKNSPEHILWRTPDYSGNIPLHWAVKNGHESIIEMLKSDIDVKNWYYNETSLHLVIWHCPKFLPKVAHVSNDLNQQDKDGCTALYSACRMRAWEAARTLLQAGADPNVCNRWGHDGLDAALVEEASETMVLEIIRRSRHMRWPAPGVKEDKTPMHMAASCGYEHAIRALLGTLFAEDVHRVVNMPNPEGMTPLDLARRGNHKGAVSALEDAL